MQIPDEQKIKLESMQIKGIRWMIWDNIDKEAIESRILQIKGQGFTNDITKLVNAQSRATLIQLIEQSPEITTTIIDAAYEKYRYGLKPGFTLFWAKHDHIVELNKNDIENKIKDYFRSIKYGEDDKYKGLEFNAITKFGDVYEISVTYLQRFNFIDENGEFTFIYMMKEGFVWIGIDRNFIAINNLPESLMNTLKDFFSRLYRAKITNIKITNDLLNKVFPKDNTKKITRHNPNPSENQLAKVSFADPKLSEKQDCIPAGYEDYDVVNTQFIEDIDGTTTGTLGVNCDKGKMYLSKSLTSTQFRAWSTRRIDDIIGYFQNSADITLDSITSRNMFSSSAWKDVKDSSIHILNEIVYAIVNCKKAGIGCYPVSFETYKAYTELSKFFIERISFVCDNCEETAIPYCQKCGRSDFSITKKAPIKIICQNCGDIQQNSFDFVCENGHLSTYSDINEFLELISNDSFSERLFDTIHAYFEDVSFDKNEFFAITNSGLELHNSPNYAKLKPSDISEFEPICNRKLTHNRDELIKLLKSLKEKCGHPTTEQCAKCKECVCNSEHDIGCILKLFENFEGFVPQPHQGHEFGDISMLVSIDGRNLTFLGAAKSGINKITKSSQLGREIIQQTLDALNDLRAEVIGTIYPGLLDDQLKYLLYHEAKLHNKHFVILDEDFMINLLDKYLEEKGIQ